MGSCASRLAPGRNERVWCSRFGWQRLGMDANEIRTIPWICGHALLPRLFREFLRWQTLRDEGRVAANCRLHVAAILPELVSTALSVRLRDIPLRGRLAPTIPGPWELTCRRRKPFRC